MLLTMILISFTVSSGDISRKSKAEYRASQHPKGSGIGTSRYNNRYYGSPYSIENNLSPKNKAEYRAAQHPKGSGIGTNRYSSGRYDRVQYPIDKYKRLDHPDN